MKTLPGGTNGKGGEFFFLHRDLPKGEYPPRGEEKKHKHIHTRITTDKVHEQQYKMDRREEEEEELGHG